MAQGVFHNYTDVVVRYELTCRGEGVDLAKYAPFIEAEIKKMSELRFLDGEIEGMGSNLPFLKNDFLQYLRGSILNPDYVTITEDESVRGGLSIVIEGPWLETIWFEVPILAIISEVYILDQLYQSGRTESEALEEARETLAEKIYKACKIYGFDEFPNFADFGTRRRASVSIHRELVGFLNTEYNCCIGTSNVMLGLENNMKIVGTMAHEWLMAHAAFTRFDLSQRMALDVWQKEYRDQLGVALSDTYTTDFFLKDFDDLLAKSFSGVRQDSGDPVEVGYKFIRHYESFGIDPMTKQIIFSDSLNFDKIAMLAKEFEGKIQAGFGIGTCLTNDIGIKPLNIVIKMSYAQRGNNVWYPMIKLSDVPGKTMCKDKEYAEFVRKIIKERIAS